MHIDGEWDLLIAHPPCTYLTNCATRAFSLRMTPPEKVVKRWENRCEAAILFMQFALAKCKRLLIDVLYKPETALQRTVTLFQLSMITHGALQRCYIKKDGRFTFCRPFIIS